MGNTLRLIPIIKKISENQYPGKKMLQKLVYLIERKGLNLGYDYGIHYYGPYSSKLDYAIHSLEMQRAIEIVQDGMTQRIHTTDIANMLISENEESGFSEDQLMMIQEVIEVFGRFSAWDLEVITTTDFVANQLYHNQRGCDEASIIAGVKNIKGDKFTDDQIREAIYKLKDQGIFIH